MSERVYRVLRAIARAIYWFLFPYTKHGLNHVPPSGALILCGNHPSLGDPVLAACSVDRPIRFMAKKELFAFKPFAFFLRKVGVFPVDRGGNDLGAVRTALALLKGGEALGIFPQGRREFKGGDEFHAGVALIALRASAPVVPMFFSAKTRPFRRTHVYFGPPVDLSPFAGKFDSETMKSATARIQAAVFALRPDESPQK